MRDLVVALCLGLGGLKALQYVVTTRSALARADAQPRSLAVAAHGDVVDITATVVDGPVLTSPLQHLPAVFWHVRAITISSLRRVDLSRTEAERTSTHDFEVESDGVRLRLHGAGCRIDTGMVKVAGDQGWAERDLVVQGERIRLRPIAHGVRDVLEGTLRPGDRVSVNGRLDTTSTPWRLTAVDDQRGVTIDTVPREVRRRRAGGIVAFTAAVGVLFLALAVRQLL